MNTPKTHPREDEAAAYVFGQMDATERIAFVKTMNSDDSLRALVDELNQTAAVFTLTAPQIAPPAAVRDRLMESIKTIPQDGAKRESKVTITKSTGSGGWGGWAAAACFAIMAALLGREMVRNTEMESRQSTLEKSARAYEAMNSSVQLERSEHKATTEALKQALAKIEASNQALQQRLVESAKAGEILQQQLADSTKTSESMKQELAQRAKANEDLKIELATLTKANNSAKMQIATLQSTVKEYKQGVAVVVWNPEKQTGILKLEKMPPIAAGKDYNLWVIEGKKTPVSAGVVTVDEKGFAKVDFKPGNAIQQADAFALSVEAKGGAPAGGGPLGPVILVGN